MDDGMGTPENVASRIVVQASDASADVTGQAIGIGGDKLALWSHPQEKATDYTDGGWSADAIARSWTTGVGAEPESYGIPMPAIPAMPAAPAVPAGTGA